jgi:hypothetical protein
MNNPIATTRRSFTVALASAALGGCVINRVARDGESLKASEGLLVFQASSNAAARMSYIEYSPQSTFGSRMSEQWAGPKGNLDFHVGEKYFVVPLKAGEYMWSKLEVYPKFAWLQSTNRFRVHPGAITYIGHIRLFVQDTSFRLTVADRESDMREYMSQNYAAYSKSLPLEKAISELRL